MARRQRATPEINSGSMADIAFLLLIFFLVTATISSERGIMLQLPPKPEVQDQQVKIQERNLFKIYLNSKDNLLVEGEPVTDLARLKSMVKEFVLNYGANPTLSDSPEAAVISYKTDRGTSYERYLQILDILTAAYNEMYGERVGITAEEFRKLDLKDPKQKELYDRAREKFPKNISFAEPTKVGE